MFDKMLGGLMKQYGVTQEHVNMVMQTIQGLDAAVKSIPNFRTASGEAMRAIMHEFSAVNNRLNDIETSQHLIHSKLDALLTMPQKETTNVG